MISVCANCLQEGKPAVMGEKEPFEDRRESHGICAAHVAAYFAEIRERKSARETGEGETR